MWANSCSRYCMQYNCVPAINYKMKLTNYHFHSSIHRFLLIPRECIMPCIVVGHLEMTCINWNIYYNQTYIHTIAHQCKTNVISSACVFEGEHIYQHNVQNHSLHQHPHKRGNEEILQQNGYSSTTSLHQKSS